MRRTIILLAAAAMAAAATPPGDAAEITDPCGDVESEVLGERIDHPVPADTDLAFVDVADRAAGGVDVAIGVCGDDLPVGTNGTLRLNWDLPTSGDCDAVFAELRIVDGVDQAGHVATYGLTCVQVEDCPPPLGLGGACSNSDFTPIAEAEVPVTVDGTTLTVALASDLPGALGASLAPGTRLTDLHAFGSSVAGTNNPYTSVSGVTVEVSWTDRAVGRDRVIGDGS